MQVSIMTEMTSQIHIKENSQPTNVQYSFANCCTAVILKAREDRGKEKAKYT